MFFERFDLWGEERLGLLSGISFVLMGALIYLLFRINLRLLSYLPLALMILSGATIAYLFQLPRLKNTRRGVATLLGGLMIGVTIVFYSLIGALESSRDILGEVAVMGISATIGVLSFFAMGFLLLAIFPESGEGSVEESEEPVRVKKDRKKKEVKENAEEEDFLERIERL